MLLGNVTTSRQLLRSPVALCLRPLAHGGSAIQLQSQVLQLRVQFASPEIVAGSRVRSQLKNIKHKGLANDKTLRLMQEIDQLLPGSLPHDDLFPLLQQRGLELELSLKSLDLRLLLLDAQVHALRRQRQRVTA